MKIEWIELVKLLGHPLNANKMTAERRGKLKREIGRTGRYEPLVVRRHPRLKGHYEILNGHQRRAVLEELGHEAAECVVWDVSNDEALVLLATLNRLRGDDDPCSRGMLLELLEGRFDVEALLARLPDTRAEVARLLATARPVEVKPPAELGELPGAWTAFVTKEQRKLIEEALRRLGEQRGKGERGRGALLARLAEEWLAGESSGARREGGAVEEGGVRC